MKDIEMRLARSCAHGVRQKELVNELLAGPIRVHLFEIPGAMRNVTLQYGSARVDRSSWKNLRSRLVANGFYFVETRDGFRVEMKFSA